MPHVSYKDDGNGWRATVMHYLESEDLWAPVGQAGFSSGACRAATDIPTRAAKRAPHVAERAGLLDQPSGSACVCLTRVCRLDGCLPACSPDGRSLRLHLHCAKPGMAWPCLHDMHAARLYPLVQAPSTLWGWL